MAAVAWIILQFLGRIALGLPKTIFLGWIASLFTDAPALGLASFADDILVAILKKDLTNWQIVALNVFVAEAERIVHEGIVVTQEDDAQRQARHAALVRWHGNRIYLYGDISLKDAALLWWSGREVVGSELFQTVFQWDGSQSVVESVLETILLL